MELCSSPSLREDLIIARERAAYMYSVGHPFPVTLGSPLALNIRHHKSRHKTTQHEENAFQRREKLKTLRVPTSQLITYHC